MRRLPRLSACLLLLVATSCGGDAEEPTAGESTARVSIAAPADGATVASPFTVTMEAEGFAIESAGEVAEGAGHFHLADAGCLPAGEGIPADEAHLHLDDGAAETELSLPAGEHTLCLQAGDGQHTALDLTHEIAVTVAEGGDETTTAAEDGEALEDWFGTYEGEVVWDCGAAGTRRGSLSAEVGIFTWPDGLADLQVEHTVSGSCADTGALTTRFGIDGERTATGFRFPSALWGIPGSFSLRVDGTRAEGRLSGEVPGPGTMTIVFDLECERGC